MNEDRATRYHRSRRRAALASAVGGLALLIVFTAGGRSSGLAAWASAVTASLVRPLGTISAIALYVAVLAIAWDILSFPFVFYRTFLLDRRYGLTSESVATWLGDHLKALVLGLALTLGAAMAMYGAVWASPASWWLILTGAFVIAAIAIARVAPVWLMPIFYRFRPLERDSLRERLLALASRAGVPAIGAFEWGLGEKTSRANAALVGAGRTRRILVSDTLLKDYSEDEIEVILAHELAHHVHRDLWTSLAIETVVVAAALLGAHVAVTRLSPSFGLHGPADLAALPLVVAAAGLVSLLLAPVSNAWSRRNEHRADRFALTMTGRAEAFVSAMRRLGAQNLAEERPSRLVFWFFHTHPTIEDRIARARLGKPA